MACRNVLHRSVLMTVGEGVLIGVISAIVAREYGLGLVAAAVGLTVLVLAVMLSLGLTGAVTVTTRFTWVVATAMLVVVALYFAALALYVFGAAMPVLGDPSPAGIALHIVIAGVAALWLLTDLDRAEQGARRGWSREEERRVATYLLMDLVWLYLLLLHLLTLVWG
ncbi:Bax inhibitor-1/YccA family membrane protein [Bailinhaonella thermotolerans]|uniref:Bax inhibitor-1/YccA family protein n=1 Tax=Bailinhaonella thermotolerans TaxID=1070861 RepID=A0A3A4AA83_9ACTN|nr:Bax inhibitor-1/YccA family protein [Bailinhaonella thermotolerans]RJL23284.1 hypothetical protein D5H75_33525 [Bailinhaonella thermotolerans]